MTPASSSPPVGSRDPRTALPRLDRHRPKCGPVAASRASRWRAGVLVLVHIGIGLHLAQWLATGTTISPIEPSEAMTGLETGKINAGFLFFAAAIVVTLVFGRWICGWACHLVAVQDLSAWLLGRIGLRPRPIRSRLLILAPFALGGYMFVWPQLLRWTAPAPAEAAAAWRVDLFVNDLWRTFPGPIMAVLTFVVVGFLMVWWLGAKGFCTHGCPYGAFFALADRLAPARIRVTAACEHCGHCTQACSSNVRVHEEVARHGMVVDPGCMKCLDCVSVCPKDALYFGFGGVRPLAVSQQRVAARADFGWGEEVLLAVVGFAAFWGFRGAWFGESVPLLLAVGLGALTAVIALLAFRLLRLPELAFQHTALRAGGRLLAAGRWGLGLAIAWLGFAVHSGWVNHAGAAAVDDALVLLREQRAQGGVAADRFRAVADRLARIDGLALLTPPQLLGAHGLVLRELSGRSPLPEHAAAIAQLERMVARRFLDRARMPAADDALATYYLALGRLDEAAALARDVLEHVPDDATAAAILRQIDERRR